MKITSFASLMLLIAVAGCKGEGVTRPPPTNIRVLHAASNVDLITFKREENIRNPIELSYGGGAGATWDSGPYTINLDYMLGNSSFRAFSFDTTLSPNLDYTFVAVSSPGQPPEILTFTTDHRPPESVTEPRITVTHAFAGLGAVDVYMEAPGTALGGAVVRGTINYGELLTFELAAETYRLYLTPAGDPATVLFESSNQPIGAVREVVYVVYDPAEQGLTEISVSRVGGVGETTGRLGQVGLGSGLRVINALTDRLDRDFYLDDTTSPPLFPAQPFGAVSDYAEVTAALHPFIVTPVGNPGTEELSASYGATLGQLFTLLVAEDANNAITFQTVPEDKRSMLGQGTLRVLDGAGLFGLLNVYLVQPGTDITTVSPNVQIVSPGYTPRAAFPPGNYDVVVEDSVTQAILAGPVPVTMTDGGVYGIAIVNAAGGSTVDLVLFDDFVP